ncbi:glycosyltransferase family 2 protein [Vibrio alginolyticus]|uniref:glycosyltransferase family 2 protein n=1 Tax=Vibrio sp. 1167 TaxID=3074546 RepID=UPI00146F04CB|nr:glycosyltransferase family 2 protein [Vibrio sp. 1167]MDW2301103.1 glycosyltransferase family 2 protein [Vibrio sp. 1167]NMT95775.1 glycosyltransferase family 2 protein [Vibrio alginolyticus]
MLRIVIPTYNRADRVIDLAQSFMNLNGRFEIVIVDDNSRSLDKKKLAEFGSSVSHLDKYRIVFNESNTGGAGARVLGAELGGVYSYIWFLDDDDQISVSSFSGFLQYLQKEKPSMVVFPSIYNGVENRPVVENLKYKLRRYGQNFNTSCCVFSKEIYIKSGGWDKELVAGQDTDLFLRMSYLTDGTYYGDIKILVVEHEEERITTNWKKQMRGKRQFIVKNHHRLHPLRTLRYILTYVFFVPYFKYLYQKVLK